MLRWSSSKPHRLVSTEMPRERCPLREREPYFESDDCEPEKEITEKKNNHRNYLTNP